MRNYKKDKLKMTILKNNYLVQNIMNDTYTFIPLYKKNIYTKILADIITKKIVIGRALGREDISPFNSGIHCWS